MKTQIEKFYQFMTERENIRLRRAAGLSPPWTDNRTLRDFKFTNVKRAHDRTTRELKAEFYDINWKIPEVGWHTGEVLLLNCALFRFFGTVEMAREIGWHTTWGPDQRDMMEAIADERLHDGETVFTRAYIVPNCGDKKPKYQVVGDIIDQVWEHVGYIRDSDAELPQTSWQQMCERMQERVRGVGSFMAKEVVLDYVLASRWTPADWDTWTPVGPGARKGAARVLHGGALPGPLTERDALGVCRSLFAERDAYWTHEISLELTDIQFQLCEYDKFLRSEREEGVPKNRFSPK